MSHISLVHGGDDLPEEMAASDATPERIADLADSLVGRMKQASGEIGKINDIRLRKLVTP